MEPKQDAESIEKVPALPHSDLSAKTPLRLPRLLILVDGVFFNTASRQAGIHYQIDFPRLARSLPAKVDGGCTLVKLRFYIAPSPDDSGRHTVPSGQQGMLKRCKLYRCNIRETLGGSLFANTENCQKNACRFLTNRPCHCVGAFLLPLPYGPHSSDTPPCA